VVRRTANAEPAAHEELKRLANARVILFGSRAVERLRRRSDCDLAVKPRKAFEDSQLAPFREAVEESSAIIHRVDVVGFSELDEAWRRRIEREGRVWRRCGSS
jgi:hypothetical protein